MRRRIAAAACLSWGLWLLGPGAAAVAAGGRGETASLTFDGAADDLFGCAVAADGQTVVVGAAGDDQAGSNAGAVYVFQDRGEGGEWNWHAVTRLVPKGLRPGDGLGGAIALHGNLVAVGGEGVGYILRDISVEGDWSRVHERRREAPPEDGEIGFGHAVAAGAGVAVFGAPRANVSGERSGMVFIYRQAPTSGVIPWYLATRVQGHGVDADDRFGAAVAVEGSVLVAGAPFDEDGGLLSGSVYLLFDLSDQGTWSQRRQIKITPSDPAPYATFGRGVAIAGATLVVAARGAVYLFRDTSPEKDWSSYSETKLVASDRPGDGGFAAAVALSGTSLVVAAVYDLTGGVTTGSAYLYRDVSPAADWSRRVVTRLSPSDRQPFDRFGASVAVAGSTVAVGCDYRRRGSRPAEGAVYLWGDTVLVDGFESGDTSPWGGLTTGAAEDEPAGAAAPLPVEGAGTIPLTDG